MKNILMNKLQIFLVQNNPDVLITLGGESGVTKYLEEKVRALGDLPEELLTEGKPAYIVEEICLNELTAEFRPSKFNYILAVLEDEFEAEYAKWLESGVLTFEVINLLHTCNPIFVYLGFTEENEDDRKLRYAIIRTIQQHLIGVTIDTEYLNKIAFL